MIENNFTERLNHPDDIKKYFSSKTFKDFLADKTSPLVYCTLSLDGKEFLNKSSFEIVLNQKTNDHDSFTITVPDDALDSFSGYVLENSKNILGKKITINFHRFGEVKNLFSGVIANIKNKKENGYGKLFITGFAPSILLESGKDCKSFEDKTLEQIIKEVTSEYPEEAKIDASNIVNSSYSIPYTVQYKESDYGFIQRLAKRYGEYFYYNGQQLVFGNKVQPIISLEDGVDLIEAEFELSIKPQDFKYMVYDSEKGSKTEKDSSSTRTQYKENPFQAIAVSASKNVFKKIPDMLYNHTGIGSDTDKALSEVVRREKENRENLVTVTGKSKDPNLKIGGRAKLMDINNKAMETYRIIEIKHFHNGNEYYNEFVGIPDLFNAPYQDNEAFPIGEEQSARVVDNNDAMGRVRVQFTWQEKKGEKTPWLRIATLHTGAGKGTHIIPEIGEEVLVAYESGNAEKPYVSGALYNGKEKSGYHTAGNDLKVIQTRSGCKILINDDKGSILLQDANGSRAFLDGQGNIDFNSAKKINLDSKEINLRAEKIKLESSEELDIKSYQKAKFTSFQTMNIDSTKSLKVNSTNMSMNAMESFKTTAQKVDFGAEKQMKISSQSMEVHGTETMDLKSPTLNKVTQAEKISLADGDKKDNQFIAVVTPTTSYKGEFGIDYCEMDDKFEKIKTFQGTDISDIEYIFEKATNQYKKVAAGDTAEKQNIIKEMYFPKTIFGKNYLATWMNIPKGVKANVIISTKLVGTDESKEKPAEEYITFQESPNFKVTYQKKTNGNIKLEAVKKGSYEVEIEALNTIETAEYLTMLDETGSIVGVIEMAPNKIEELEIKIIPVILKQTDPTTEPKLAEAIYNKAIAAKNAKNLNLNDTLNQQSLNQAGIKSTIVVNPKGAEKLVIDVTMDPEDTRVFIDIVFKTDPKTKEEKGIYYINYYYTLKPKD